MPIEIHSLVDGTWRVRNKLSTLNMMANREDVVDIAKFTAQQWPRDYEPCTLRVVDTETGKEV